MSTPLTDQLRAYFDDVDRQQGTVDIDAVRGGAEEEVVVIELSPDHAAPPSGPTPGRRWPTVVAVAAAVVLVVAGALLVSGGDDTQVDSPADSPSTVTSTTTVVTLSPELVARPLDPPIACDAELCPSLAVSRDGTLVAYDAAVGTLTWYEDEPRVVPISAELSGNDFDGDPWFLAIGPHDVAYFVSWGPTDHLVAVAPSGAEIEREFWGGGHDRYLLPTWSGLVARRCTFINNRCTDGSEWPSPDAELAMPWVDLAGNAVTDARPYPAANGTTAGIEVRLGRREWLLTLEQWEGHQIPRLVPRSDGGVVMLHDETFHDMGQPIKLLELLPDGTIERYVIDYPSAVLPDGSVIVERNLQLVRLTPPA